MAKFVSMLVWAGISMLFISSGLPIGVEAAGTGVKDRELMAQVEGMMQEHMMARIRAVTEMRRHEELLGESLMPYHSSDHYEGDSIFGEFEYVLHFTGKFCQEALLIESLKSSREFDDQSHCKTPRQLAKLISEYYKSDSYYVIHREPRRILDVGVGNSRFGFDLHSRLQRFPGIARSVGTDVTEPMGRVPHKDWILEKYDELTVADLADHSSPIVTQWKTDGFDLVTICSEGNVSLDAIDAAIESLVDGGLLAFTINLKKIRTGVYSEFVESLHLGDRTALWRGMREIRRKVFDHCMKDEREHVGYAAFIYQKVGREETVQELEKAEQKEVQQKVNEQVGQQEEAEQKVYKQVGQQDKAERKVYEQAGQQKKVEQKVNEQVGHQQKTVTQQHEKLHQHEQIHQHGKSDQHFPTAKERLDGEF